MTTINKETRSNALSVRAKLRKALAVEGDILTATERGQLEKAIERLNKAMAPKKTAKKKAAKKTTAKKTSTKKAPVKKAA